MEIEKLIKKDEITNLSNIDFQNVDIDGMSFDSRNPGENKIFFASYGANSDGNEYINKAVENNYKIIVTDKEIDDLKNTYNVDFDLIKNNNVSLLKVNEVNEYLALVCERFYDFPAKELKLVGVTGTNGKTTTTSLIHECLKAFGKKTGLVGTMEIHYDDEIEASKNTTPDTPKLQSVYRHMLEKNCEYNVMEVSSHSLALKRICDEEFEVGVYTNLTEDHLDYHKTMENYRDAKLLLFKKSKNCVINMDTEYSDFYINSIIEMNKNILIYGIDKENNLKLDEKIKKYKTNKFLIASNVNVDITGSAFKCTYFNDGKEISTDIKVKTPGEFSVYNALSAVGTLLELGFDLEEIKNVLVTLPGITGRFQTFTSKDGFGVAVDYAHTPDGLLNILQTAKSFVKGNIITVFGCGGDRDKLKRPIMGRIVMELSDIAIVTSDNPRTEDPEQILVDIEAGMKEFDKEYIKICDRYEATKKAIELAKPGDFVIIAGKGHEDYQIIGKEKIHFSDIENVQNLLK
ncbi:MAG: UDP-N-acetylmuramoyl-L-alanyl-D-glutamate--2,6-diaminopimelate ligase [Clostridia bacterium]|nr:UDP-N-acetylmuramoyl-L-alanyl-D-glutamate--2,6-diaminopimelate ligase [Clostridia bacterium]